MSSRKKTNKLKEKETDWQERIVQVRRVTKVVKGGKKLSFRAILIIGNEKGQVGVGVGKASDVIGAVKKAVTDSKKHCNGSIWSCESDYSTISSWVWCYCRWISSHNS
jgi:small subunit ribosomal protein S5